MKKMIIILGTILLGVFIVASLIMGDTGSLKSGAKSVVDRSNSIISDTLLLVEPK